MASERSLAAARIFGRLPLTQHPRLLVYCDHEAGRDAHLQVDVKGKHVDVKGNHVDVMGNHVDVMGNSVDVKGRAPAGLLGLF